VAESAADDATRLETADRFVGRTAELRQALAACAATRHGRGSLVVVSGPPGIGKTRFCHEVAHHGRQANLAVAATRCRVDGGAPALWPWQPILTGLCSAHADDLLDSDAGSPTVDPDRFARFCAVTDRLADACRRTPACLIIDDIHAADAGSLLLTRFVARSLDRLPLTLMVTRRPDEPPDEPRAALVDEIEREAIPIVLRPFDLEETTRFFVLHGLSDVSRDLVGTLHQAAGGNPLFLRRIAALGPSGSRTPPSGVRTAIDLALDRLRPATRSTLRAGAILGVTPTAADVVQIEPGLDRVSVVDAIDEACKAGLVMAGAPDRFTFTHELVRAALEDSLDATHRLDLHARAATVVADDAPTGSDGVARRAHHALAAAPRSADDARRAVDICREAARLMGRRFGYEQADALLSAAVDLHETSELGSPSAELLVEWAQAALACGRLTDARHRFDRAVEVAEHGSDPSTFAQAALGMGGHWVNERRDTGERARVLGLQKEALARLGPGDLALRRRLEARLAAEAVYDGGPIGAAWEALTAARACGDPVALAEALSLCHHALLTPQNVTERLAIADELVQVASETGQGLLALVGLCWRAVDLFHRGDDRAVRALEDLRERASALACQSILYIVEVMDVMLLLRAGRLDDAEIRAGRCYEFGVGVGEADAFAYLGAHMLAIRWLQGRQVELRSLAEEVADSPTLVEAEFAFRASAAGIAADAGDVATAERVLADFERVGLAALPQSSTWLAGMHAIVETAATLPATQTAAQAYDLLLPFADQPIMPSLSVVCLGSTHRSLGVAARTFGDIDLAISHLERAVAQNYRLGNRPLVAIAQAELASTLRQRNRESDRDRAAGLSQQAIRAAESMGMTLRAEAWRADEDAADRERHGTIRRDVGGWLVAVDGRTVQVADLLGMRYLAELLTRPGRPVRALDLAAAGDSGTGADASQQVILDGDAYAAYAIRVRKLTDDLVKAEYAGDLRRADSVRSEIAVLQEQLQLATGLGGRKRTFTGPSERARTAVRKAVVRALDQIEAADPVLGQSLRASITTGTECVYIPDARSPIVWSR
jgi:tetratricopeptide (TPR) repeat protein